MDYTPIEWMLDTTVGTPEKPGYRVVDGILERQEFDKKNPNSLRIVQCFDDGSEYWFFWYKHYPAR
jgi:hypothetical protein